MLLPFVVGAYVIAGLAYGRAPDSVALPDLGARATWASTAARPSPTVLDGGTGEIPADIARDLWQIELHRLDPASVDAYLHHPDARVRARVGRALGRLREAGGTKSVARLQGLVNDASPEVRAEAAWALGQLPGMTTLLRRWNIEKDPRVRAALARAMGFRGSDDTVQALVAALDGAERGEAAEALGRLGAQGVVAARRNAVVAKLLDLVEDRTALEARTRAAWAIGRMGLTSTSDDNLLRMRALVVVPDRVDVRANLVRAWTPLASGASRAEVLPGVAAGPPALRIAAVRAAARSPYDGAAPLVASLVSDPDPFVRREAVAALAKVKPRDPRAILAGAWTSSDPLERAAAITALAELRSLPASPASLLADDLPLQVRYAAVGAVKDPNRLLALALRAPEAPLRSVAAETLFALEPFRREDALRILRGDDQDVAQAAAEALVSHPDPASEAALVEVLARPGLAVETGISTVRALDAVYATGRLPRPGPALGRTLDRWLRVPRLRAEAERLCKLIGIDAPPPTHPQISIPDLAEVLRIRGARIFTDEGEVRVDFRTEDAPYTVWNFVRLAEGGAFDGRPFHRVIPGFVAQTGDPRGDGWGGPGWVIPDEIHPGAYDVGTLGMALSGPDTGGSQWFVTLASHPHLDGGYTLFGDVVEGLRVARGLTPLSRIQRVVIERRE